MIDLQFVGYTADLQHLVFDLQSGTGEGRYRLLIDADLFATMDTLRDARREEGLPVGDPDEYDWIEHAEEDEDVADDAEAGAEDADADEPEIGDDEVVAADGEEADADVDLTDLDDEDGDDEDGAGDRTDPEVHVVSSDDDDDDDDAEHAAAIRARAARPGIDARDGDGPELSPSEIQALLRRGRSVRSVARSAGCSQEWVERWLPPIEAERERILDAARAIRLERARLGRSRESMGAAVNRHLLDKGVSLDDVKWEAARHKDGRWRVSVIFVHRRRRTKASWLYDPSEGTLEPSNDAGTDLGFTRPRQRV